jgi:hypothetical protein
MKIIIAGLAAPLVAIIVTLAIVTGGGAASLPFVANAAPTAIVMTPGASIAASCSGAVSVVVDKPNISIGCAPVATDTATASPSATETETSTATPTNTATVTPTDTPTSTNTATSTAVPTNTSTSTATGVPSATATNTFVPSSTPLPTGTLAPTATVLASGPKWYVSKSGSNLDGRSPATAWNELSQIGWASIQPGDTILVAPGTYLSSLLPTRSGTAAAPIKVLATGPVIIFGGRSTPLPYCEQPTYVFQTGGVRAHGIDFGGVSNVVVDGGTWRGITITGHNDSGVKLSGSNNTLRNAEVTDNGTANFNATAGYWRPDFPGVSPGGSGNHLDRDIIHDNGQDALQTGQAVNGMTITNDWHYNARIHPVHGAAVPWNYCMHSDGFQIYDGGMSQGISFSNTILGPGFMQGTILGQTPSRAVVNNVSFSNVLVIGDFNAGIMGYGTTNPTGWSIDHTTIYMARSPNWAASPGSVVGTGWNESLILDGSGHRITNSVVFDGRVLVSGASYSGNCEWSPYGNGNLMTGSLGGLKASPQFLAPPPLTSPDATSGTTSSVPTGPTLQQLLGADYTVGGGSACAGRGSSLGSVAQLLAQ